MRWNGGWGVVVAGLGLIGIDSDPAGHPGGRVLEVGGRRDSLVGADEALKFGDRHHHSESCIGPGDGAVGFQSDRPQGGGRKGKKAYGDDSKENHQRKGRDQGKALGVQDAKTGFSEGHGRMAMHAERIRSPYGFIHM